MAEETRTLRTVLNSLITNDFITVVIEDGEPFVLKSMMMIEDAKKSEIIKPYLNNDVDFIVMRKGMYVNERMVYVYG